MRIRNTLLIFLGIAKIAFSAKTPEEEAEEAKLPKFSLPGGFYDNEIEVEISTKEPGSIIYYTLDGTDPTTNSTVYSGPIALKNKTPDENVHSAHAGIAQPGGFFGAGGAEWVPAELVTKGNVLRAIAVNDGVVSNITSSTFFVGVDRVKQYKNLPIVSLITDPDNLFDYETGIYVLGEAYDEASRNGGMMFFAQGNFNQKGKEAERRTTVEYIPGDSNLVDFNQDLGLKMKGRSTRGQYQKSFNLNARAEYGKKSIKYQLIPGNMRSDKTGPVTKYKSFNLRNAGNDSDAAKMRDVVIQDLIENDYFETQQNCYCVVFIDGEYWGIYEIYEEYNDNYISNNYDIDKDNVVTLKENNIDDGTEEDYQLFANLLNFVCKNDMSIESNYLEAQNLIDTRAYALYCAFAVYIDVQDGYYRGGNNAMWRVREPVPDVPKADGKWRMMAYDHEFSTGLYSMGSNYQTSVISTFATSRSTNPRLTTALLRSDDFRNMFINYLCDMVNINYSVENVTKKIDELEEFLIPFVTEHIKRNGPSTQLADPINSYKAQVDTFRSYMVNRAGVFISTVQRDFSLSAPVEVSVTVNDFSNGSFIVNEFNELNEAYTGKYFRENILFITAKPNEGKSVKSWGLKNCKLAFKEPNKIGFYPNTGCSLTINYE